MFQKKQHIADAARRAQHDQFLLQAQRFAVINAAEIEVLNHPLLRLYRRYIREAGTVRRSYSAARCCSSGKNAERTRYAASIQRMVTTAPTSNAFGITTTSTTMMFTMIAASTVSANGAKRLTRSSSPAITSQTPTKVI